MNLLLSTMVSRKSRRGPGRAGGKHYKLAFLDVRRAFFRAAATETVFIELPPGVTAKAIACDIKAASMTLGLKGNPPFLSESFESSVDSSDSYWTVEDGSLLHIILTCAACQPLHSS